MREMKLYKNKNWLHQKYVDERLPIRQISKICKVPGGIIHEWLTKFSIPIRDQSQIKKSWWKNHPGISKGKNNANWKGGRITRGDGYIRIYQPNHPYAQKGRYVLEHRLVMEQKVGRYLYPWEIVHHINGIRNDNRLENLELLPSLGKHNNFVQKVFKENQQLKKTVIMLFLFIGQIREKK